MSVETDKKPAGLKTHSVGWLFEKFGLLIFLVLLLVLAGVTSPAFLNPENLVNILTIAAPLGMVVLGQAMVIMVRGLDLSVASVMATVAVLATTFKAESDSMIVVIFIAGIAFSAVVGLFNGYLVAKRGVSPVLATLATMIILQGIRFAYTGGAPVSTLPDGMSFLASGRILGIPVNLMTLALLTVVLGVLLHRARFGREVYMVGGNPVAARLNGLSPDRVTMLCYMICSIMAGIGGLFLLGYVGTVSNWVGQGYELDSIVAAVMGGVALSGGRGTIFGALMGVAVLIIINNIVILWGLPIEVQLMIKGVIIIGAAAFYRARLL